MTDEDWYDQLSEDLKQRLDLYQDRTGLSREQIVGVALHDYLGDRRIVDTLIATEAMRLPPVSPVTGKPRGGDTE